jgi:hypothetical protein
MGKFCHVANCGDVVKYTWLTVATSPIGHVSNKPRG